MALVETVQVSLTKVVTSQDQAIRSGESPLIERPICMKVERGGRGLA